VDEPVYFVDFLREPVVDEETGETVDAHPSNYEAVPGGLAEIRTRVEALQRKFNEESKVRHAAMLQHVAVQAHCTMLGGPACEHILQAALLD
jgi:hypothetical protein